MLFCNYKIDLEVIREYEYIKIEGKWESCRDLIKLLIINILESNWKRIWFILDEWKWV